MPFFPPSLLADIRIRIRIHIHAHSSLLPSPLPFLLSSVPPSPSSPHPCSPKNKQTSMSGKPRLPSVKDLLNSPEQGSSADHASQRSPQNTHASQPLPRHTPLTSPDSRIPPFHRQFPLDQRNIPRSSALPHISLNSTTRWNPPDGGRLPSVREVLSGERSAADPMGYSHPHLSGSGSGSGSRAGASSSSSSPASTAQGQQKGGFPCERCGRLFTRKSDAHKHIRVVHDRLKVYACRVCGRKFARKDYCVVSCNYICANEFSCSLTFMFYCLTF